MKQVTCYYCQSRKWRRLLKKRFSLTNRETGEKWDGDIEEPGKRRKPTGRKFIFMQQSEMETLIDGRVRGQEMRLLLLLMSRCSWTNQVHYKRKQIGERLGISVENVYHLVKRLQAGKFLWCDPDDNASFAINPMLCWKSDPELRAGAYGDYQNLFRQPHVQEVR